ncbi:hypothetical protein PPL_08908 [Heterostelium album PN500]|uniref:Uncharacterized protein n=1 Tax=Heterostelium pallidum (strain ATCC 26659 / Pp 5 / PN500) TaxID=670386 RepID=D3BK27_HETP5|nr:hypothetical protein PPL_08908 [Heterostelium album PN500]EFA78257.1 hypothetical protein PPL_08908 [Heterostelium album PN500]|eukprot:XP_020430382.1 hypothetical protein PPL_08908 [Heterostelium album PN500]
MIHLSFYSVPYTVLNPYAQRNRDAFRSFNISINTTLTLSSVSAVPECSFTCTDGVKVILPNIESKDICEMAIKYASCPVRTLPNVDNRCIPWCPPCRNCPVNVQIESFSFAHNY